MTLRSTPWKHPVLSKLDDPPQCWQITDHGWTDLQKENHCLSSFLYTDIVFWAIFLFPTIQVLDEINTPKNYLQEIRNMSNFQTWKEMMGFNSNWRMLCLSPWDSMVCIANSCRKYSEDKENILGEETIHSTWRLQVFKKATIFLLSIRKCHLNSFRDSICL